MVKMTPEQEAAYALDFGVARSDLPEDAQLAKRFGGIAGSADMAAEGPGEHELNRTA